MKRYQAELRHLGLGVSGLGDGRGGQGQVGSPDLGNAGMVAIGRATPAWLRVSSGAEAMSLLLTSERVFADMIDWLK